MSLDLRNGDCLEVMKTLEDKSIDLIFCDLPYGQTSCKWDCPIDLDKFWIEVMRIKKLNTPIFMTTTTKFGVSLINSAPKKCFFRYDIVWVKSAPAGFLSAKKMPMRKHEMIYVFYEKLPFYDLSSHKHKFIKATDKGEISVVKEEKTQISKAQDKSLYGASNGGTIGNVHGTNYDPPLPVSVVKEELETLGKKQEKNLYGRESKGAVMGQDWKKVSGGVKIYEPPLPTSIVKEVKSQNNYHNQKVHHYTDENGKRLKEDCQGSKYDPPLPTSMLEVKSTRGKHSTEKPVALMEWIFKYYSKEGDTILDPTMGSGSTGVACRNMNRNFIGIEMDEDIFKTAFARLG